MTKHLVPIYIEEEMKKSYLDYAMSVIISRALPDVRDGLKPVHRRILFAMNDMGLQHNKSYKKSARVIGEVLGKYHPHGETAIYDAMVRMAQDFSLRYTLIDGQGNFGSVDGDEAAAIRYTEVRLSRIAEEILVDLEKNTVDFKRNFDDSLEEPEILPSAIPDLLINGAHGIAVGMATNIPPHNLGEIIDATIALIDNPEMECIELLNFVKGPDFPTAGIIYGYEGIKDALLTGRGIITLRGKAEIEESKSEKFRIVITELPYQVNKAKLIEKIADLVREQRIEGISDLRDESDREGMRIVVELKRGANPNVVLNQLYKHTSLNTSFGVIMLALADGIPKVLNLKEAIGYFIEHRHEVVVRRTQFDLDKAKKRAHILEGLRIALDHIDAVINLIRKSADVQVAQNGLMTKFGLSEAQAKAILDMRLQRLTGLERQKVEDEYRELVKTMEELQFILSNKEKRMSIIKEELQIIKNKYADKRRTQIIPSTSEIAIEDLIPDEEVVITVSHDGYVKRIPLETYRKQRKGGKGVSGITTKKEDFAEQVFVASNHEYLLIVSNIGRIYWLKVYDIPQSGKQAKGTAFINLIQITEDEKIRTILPLRDFDVAQYLIFATEQGLVKKTLLSAYSKPRKGGINGIKIRPDDQVIHVAIGSDDKDLILSSYFGLAIRFSISKVRACGRNSMGVIGMRLNRADKVIGMIVVPSVEEETNLTLLSVSQFGYGKRTELCQYRRTNRGGKGIITHKTSRKTGSIIAVKEVNQDDELMIITTGGKIIRISIESIRELGRNTMGVKLINLNQEDYVVDVAKIKKEENEDNDQTKLFDEENENNNE
ncbi:MAG: DNA gyrase subunit A [Candidatus Coatesbacteria bacterium]|nr:DNA gyrase subunit A [Candidatus Coatesbacteria bacterium]